MSLISVGTIGIQRDLAGRAERIGTSSPAKHAQIAPSTTPSGVGPVASFGQLLVAQIPSEALLAYTTLLAVFSGAGGGYKTGRWILYGLSLPVCAVVVIGAYWARRDYGFADTMPPDATVAQRARQQMAHLPWFPALTAVLAMAVYGLTVPGSALQASTSNSGFAILAASLAVGGGIMMSILAPFLGQGNNSVPQLQPASP